MQQVRFIDKNKSSNQFFTILKNRVDQYFKDSEITKHYNTQMVFKTIILLSAYILPFVCILLFNFPLIINIGLWILMGISQAGIGMNIMHDANHGSYAQSGKANYWLGQTINLIGGSSFNWKLQHNILHHTYTNVADMDDDIEDIFFLRFCPHTKVRWYHRFQFIYAFFLYGILTFYWAFFKDFVQFHKYLKTGVNKESKEQNRIIFLKIVVAKIVYVGVFLILPLVILHLPILTYILGFLIMHFVAGAILSTTFQLAHTVENTSHPLPNEAGTIETAWAVHQLNTTVNFSRKSKIISWYLGGLNFQIEHHLFPSICHVHYPAIAPIVKKTAEEYGIPYLENETLFKAIGSHIQMLKNLGKKSFALQ